MEQLRKFARYFKPYKWHIVSGILCILVSMLFGLVVPYLVDPEPCVDLDTDHDFIIAEAVLSLLRREGALCL